MKKRIVNIGLVFMMCLSLLQITAFGEDQIPTFSDVREGDWFVEDVAYTYQNGLMNGIGNSLFAPDASATRGTIVTILYRMEKEPAAAGNLIFDDVQAGAYYVQAVKWASNNGIMNGYGNGKFGPDDLVTREQLAVVLYRYARYKGYDTMARGNLSEFVDQKEISDYAVDAISWAKAEGLINGTSSYTLSPRGKAARAQVAAMLHRFCDTIATWVPNPNPPAFVPAPAASAIFEELTGKTFYFTSGAGAWLTSLHISADGSFTGEFHDSDMGDTGPGYPGGTVYLCPFSGTFGFISKVNDYEYVMKLTSLQTDESPGMIIEDGVRYIIQKEPYGLNDADEFRIYLPGRSTKDLPKPFLEWVSMPHAWGNQIPATLPFWGLYNVGGEMGFTS